MSGPREANRSRTTRETSVSVHLRLDGSGQAQVATGIAFFDHLLLSLAFHARFDLTLKAQGDLEVDAHHTVEDVAIALGETLAAALQDRSGIARFGEARIPLDESLVTVALDCGGRGYAVIDLPMRGVAIGAMPVTLIVHALETLALRSGLTLHVRGQGRDDHHLAEAAFKALGRSLRAAVWIDPSLGGRVPSLKGSL